MAIAYDATGGVSQLGGSSSSYSHTCTGSNRIIFFAVRTQNALIGVSSITYNGSSTGITQIATQTAVGYNLQLWYLIAPATGANTVVVTLTGSTNWTACSTSYTGAQQSGQPDAFNSAASSSTSVTVVADGSWLVGCAGGTSLSAGSAFTQRNLQSAGGNEGNIEDSNTNVATGAQTVDVGGTAGVIIGASIKVFSVATTLTAGAGSYTYTGFAALLKKVITMVAGAGSYVYTGFTAILTYIPNIWSNQTKNSSEYSNQSKNSSSFSNQSKSSSSWTNQSKS